MKAASSSDAVGRLLLCLGAVTITAACSSPPYVSNRTVVVTSAHVPYGAGAPYEASEIRATGYVAGALAGTAEESDRLPIGRGGSYVPQLELGGQIGGAVHEAVSLHLGGTYTEFDWAAPTTSAVPPPADDGSAWALGLGMRVQFPVEAQRLDVSAFADVELLRMQESAEICRIEPGSWVDDDGNIVDPRTAEQEAAARCSSTGTPTDRRTRTHTRGRPTLGLQTGYDATPWLHVAALGSLQVGYRTPDPLVDPRSDSDRGVFGSDGALATHPVWTLAAGADATFGNFLFSAWAHVPFGGRQWARLAPSFQLRIGGRFGRSASTER